MKKVTVTAKTVDQAMSLALAELGATKDQVTVTILEEPTKGFFGFIGAKQAKIEVEVKANPLEEAKTFLHDVLKNMNVPCEVIIHSEKDDIVFEIVGEELGIVIGRRGQTLESLQLLVNTIANRHSESFLRITLDAENYREKRKTTLEQLADRLAEKAIRSGQPVKLEPMSSQERKIIHTHLQERKQISTHSEGREPNRYLVIQAKK